MTEEIPTLTRREIIRSAVASAAAAGVAILLPEKFLLGNYTPHAINLFRQDGEYGNAICWYEGPGFPREEFFLLARDQLVADAHAALPPGTRFEIRWAIPHDLGHRHAMAWYSSPNQMAQMPEWTPFIAAARDLATFDAAGGYYLVGRQMA